MLLYPRTNFFAYFFWARRAELIGPKTGKSMRRAPGKTAAKPSEAVAFSGSQRTASTPEQGGKAPAEFSFLVARGTEQPKGLFGEVPKPARTAANTVELHYSREALATRPVIWDERRSRYLVFENRASFWRWYSAHDCPGGKSMHEVVFGSAPQHLKFDIDAPRHRIEAIPVSDLLTRATGAAARPSELCTAEFLDEILGGAEAEAAAEPGHEEKMRMALGLIMDAIVEELCWAYFVREGVSPTREDIALFDSSGGDPGQDQKHSFHLRVQPYAVADHEEANEFTERVCARLPASVARLIDKCVNRRISNFRLIGSVKVGTARVKRLNPGLSVILGACQDVGGDSLVTAAPGARVLGKAYAPRATGMELAAFAESAVEKILAVVRRSGADEGFTLREARLPLITFDRVAPTMCRICQEIHHRDHTLLVTVAFDPSAGDDGGGTDATAAAAQDPEPKKAATRPPEGPRRHQQQGGAGASKSSSRYYRVVELCRHAAPTSGIELGVVRLTGAETPIAAEKPRKRTAQAAAEGDAAEESHMQARLRAWVAALRTGARDPHATQRCAALEELPAENKTVYAEPKMRAYEQTPTLLVKAPMKLGKTQALRAHLDTEYPASGLRPPVIRFVTFRQTFSASLKERFPEFALYSEIQGDLAASRYPRLIIQVESLHRIPMPANPEPVDLVILDESESILEQFSSGLHRHLNAAFAMFQWMLRTAARVICMDANLGDLTQRTIARIRGQHPVHFHWNRFARAAEDEFFVTTRKGAWLARLHQSLREGQRLVIPTNSLGEAEALEAGLRQKFPDKRVALYSSKTLPSEKNRHFADVHTHWAGLDVLLYTPTVTAGISFELEHFDALYAYFSDNSCTVETCRQMLARVRNLRLRRHDICLFGIERDVPTDREMLRRLIHDRRAGLYRAVGEHTLRFEYAPNGQLIYYESDYFHLWLEILRARNLSRNAFLERFVDQIADTGASIEAYGDEACADLLMAAGLLREHRAEKGNIRGQHAELVADAPQLSAYEASQVREKLSRQEDLAPEERLGYERWALGDVYQWHGRPMDGNFVERYGAKTAKQVYRGLCQITAGPSLAASLQEMRDNEAVHYLLAMDSIRPAAGPPSPFQTLSADAVESRDLLREGKTYVFLLHYYAVWLLYLCGFRCLTDTGKIYELSLAARLRSALVDLIAAQPTLKLSFGVLGLSTGRLLDPGRTPRDFVGLVLRQINAILRAQYGHEVARVPVKPPHASVYFLRKNEIGELFVFSHEPDGGENPRPHIPSNLRPLSAPEPTSVFLDEAYYRLTDAESEDEEGEGADRD